MEQASVGLLAIWGIFYDGKVHPGTYTWSLRTTRTKSPNLSDTCVVVEPLRGRGDDASD